MEVLQDAERRACALIEDHHEQVARLVVLLETEETLDLAAIASCLAPNPKIAALPQTRNTVSPRSKPKGHK